jgi:ferritin-like metal-binding protein YciE
MAKINTMQELFVDELRDLYDAEQQILNALPKMEQAASSAQLKSAFRTHLQQTETQRQRLEQIFREMGMQPSGKTCKGVQGIIKENEEMIAQTDESAVRDAILIGGAQKVEHYEIASYGTMRTMATQLGMQEAKRLLQQTLDEEGATDHLLTQIAEGTGSRAGVNERAAAVNGGQAGAKSRSV